MLGGDILATEPKPFQMAKSVYQSCMNKELIEKRGLEPVKSIIKKLGGWPLLEGSEWSGEGFKWYVAEGRGHLPCQKHVFRQDNFLKGLGGCPPSTKTQKQVLFGPN